MVDELTREDVETFFEENPEFLKKYASKNKIPPSALSFIEHLQLILSRKIAYQTQRSSVISEFETYREILKEFASELNEDRLCYVILQNTCILLNCDSANIFVARGTDNNRYLISKYIGVTSNSQRTESQYKGLNPIRIPFGKGIVGYVAETKRTLKVTDVANSEYYKMVDVKSFTPNAKSILSMPILNKSGKVMGVAQVMNYDENSDFSSEDEALFANLLSFCGIGIETVYLFQVCTEEARRNALLLKLTDCILKVQNNLPKLISEILQQAMEMLDCRNICVYLCDKTKGTVEPKKNSKVFQLLRDENNMEEVTIDSRFIKHLESNLKSENIFDIFDLKTYADVSVSDEDNIESWLLCMAIKDAKGNTIGSIMFIRDSKDIFSENDINMIKTFASVCGLSIFNCRLYETSVNLLEQAKITNDRLAYHTICHMKTVERYRSMKLKSAEEYQIYSFDFDDSLYKEEDGVLLCVLMFLKLDVVNILNISQNFLYRFILTVKKNYRPVAYHNWRHALNVTQTMFCMLTTGHVGNYFTQFQQICLLMACMFHDLDHRGQNNSFQVKIASSIATLYGTSVLEHHHLDRGMMILNNTGTNIFQNLPAEQYQLGLKLIEKAILATDLMNYFSRINIFKHEVESGHKEFDTPEGVDLLLNMLMTAADLSGITKPWPVQKRIAVQVAAEMFEQGDIEKNLQCEVISLMDREKRYEVPSKQVDFIDFVCTPVYKVLAELEGCLRPLYDGCLRNRSQWYLVAIGKEMFDIDEELNLASNKPLTFEEQEKIRCQIRKTSIPVDRKPTPGYRKTSVPVDRKLSAPVYRKTASAVDRKTASAVDRKTSFAVDRKAFSVDFKTSPVDRKTSQVDRKTSAVDRKTSPEGKAQTLEMFNIMDQDNLPPWSQPQSLYRAPSFIPRLKKLTNIKPSNDPIQKPNIINKHENYPFLFKPETESPLNIYSHKKKLFPDDLIKITPCKLLKNDLTSPRTNRTKNFIVYSNINKSATNESSIIENNGMEFKKDAENSDSSHRNFYSTLAPSSTSLESSVDIHTLMEEHNTLMKENDGNNARPYHGVEQVVFGDICSVSENLTRKIGVDLIESNTISTVNEYTEIHSVECDLTPNINKFRRRKCMKKGSINKNNHYGSWKTHLCVIS